MQEKIVQIIAIDRRSRRRRRRRRRLAREKRNRFECRKESRKKREQQQVFHISNSHAQSSCNFHFVYFTRREKCDEEGESARARENNNEVSAMTSNEIG